MATANTKKVWLYQVYNRRNGTIYGYFRGVQEEEVKSQLMKKLGLDEEGLVDWLKAGLYDIRKYAPGKVEY